MAYVYSLCSSSKGNSTYIGDKNSGILIDAGIGIRNFSSHLQMQDIEIDAVKAIFITHEHTDHVKGLSTILKKINVPIYGSRETLEQLIEKELVTASSDLNEIDKRSVTIADIEVSAFTTPHDSVHSLGYKIVTNDQKKLCICTDLGYVPDEVYNELKGSDFILLESNYDNDMLTYGDYPQFLKRRILSNSGHLSNELCSKTLTRLIADGTTKFLLGHLSEQNNRPNLALESALNEMLNVGAKHNQDYTLTVAPAKCVGAIIEV